MTQDLRLEGPARVLDPIDRISEVLFGLFMVLTFTGTLSVAGRGPRRGAQHAGRRDRLQHRLGLRRRRDVRAAQPRRSRGRKARLVRAVRGASRPEQAHRLIADEIGGLSGALGTAELERMRQWIVAQPPAPDTRVVRVTRARPARRGGRLPAGLPVDLSGGAAVRLHRRPGHGQARLGRGRDRDAVPLRPCLGPVRRTRSLAHRAWSWCCWGWASRPSSSRSGVDDLPKPRNHPDTSPKENLP